MVTFEGLQGRGNQALDRQGLFHLIFIGLFTGARRESAVGDCWPVQGADVSPGEISEFVGQLGRGWRNAESERGQTHP